MTKNTPTNDIAINGQYVKDLSFENPNAPKSLAVQQKPDVNVSVDLEANNLENNTYEVVLSLSASAKAGDETLFMTELSYAGVFTLNIDEEHREFVLMVHCPTIIFPFARRILADATRDGGFLPLMIDPIDFGHLYNQHKGKKAAANED
jgi:preprotein translocase subunit SecB